MEVVIEKSNKKNKKYDAVIDNKRRIAFGDIAYSDYTKHHNKERKQRYINRHKKNEDWTISGIRTPGFWSKHLLWQDTSLSKSIDALNSKYKSIDVKYKKSIFILYK